MLAAELALLLSRLVAPAGQEPASAVDETEVLRRRVQQRANILAAADWLEKQARLGREVWGRGVPEIARSSWRAADLTGLFRACLVALRVTDEVEGGFRVRLPFWTMADAIGRIHDLLKEVGEGGAVLERFLPEVTAEAPDHELRCRAAVAGTFTGVLELTRQGVSVVRQDVTWAGIRVERSTIPRG